MAVRVVFHTALVMALYLLFAGHNQPGGGFVGGLVAAAALGLQYAAGGLDQVRLVGRVPGRYYVGTGLFVATLTAMVPLVVGGDLLESGKVKLHPPLLGEIKLISVLAFDIGVFLVVMGLALMMFSAFGEAAQPEHEGADDLADERSGS
ncbi:MAG: MnhB domain-containing protein [Microthrixaceae bacterium]